MLDAAQWLIRCGVERGHISPSYQLLGHRQAKSTECPGAALYDVIKTWEHWTETPARPGNAWPGVGDPVNYDLGSDLLARPAAPAAPAAPTTPVSEVREYNPATPRAATDAVEVRQLNKRSLWDRLVQIWQKEALRQASLEASREAEAERGHSDS